MLLFFSFLVRFFSFITYVCILIYYFRFRLLRIPILSVFYILFYFSSTISAPQSTSTHIILNYRGDGCNLLRYRFLFLVRAAFFICAIEAWDPSLGTVSRDKVEFYSLDEISNTLFFSLASILALFWAELYYISIDRADIYLCIVRPVTYILNFMAFAGVIILSIIVSQYYSSDVDYMFLQYTFLITSTYLVAAIMFSYYAYMAALELEKVPLPLTTRRDRLASLRVLAIICIAALTLKGIVSIYVSEKSMLTESFLSLFLIFFYFFFCELLPICVILVFYRVESWDSDNRVKVENDDENYYSSIDRHVTEGIRTPQSTSLLRNSNATTQP